MVRGDPGIEALLRGEALAPRDYDALRDRLGAEPLNDELPRLVEFTETFTSVLVESIGLAADPNKLPVRLTVHGEEYIRRAYPLSDEEAAKRRADAMTEASKTPEEIAAQDVAATKDALARFKASVVAFALNVAEWVWEVPLFPLSAGWRWWDSDEQRGKRSRWLAVWAARMEAFGKWIALHLKKSDADTRIEAFQINAFLDRTAFNPQQWLVYLSMAALAISTTLGVWAVGTMRVADARVDAARESVDAANKERDVSRAEQKRAEDALTVTKAELALSEDARETEAVNRRRVLVDAAKRRSTNDAILAESAARQSARTAGQREAHNATNPSASSSPDAFDGERRMRERLARAQAESAADDGARSDPPSASPASDVPTGVLR